ncbi:MAG: hypothetical protein IKP69_08880 [Oscillospiraceae bacterium]|nr:hypothetical protein [Oscillospiraceae bacterium]
MNPDFILSEIKKLFDNHDYAEETFLSLNWQNAELYSNFWNLNYPDGLNFLLMTFSEAYIAQNFTSAVLQCFITNTALDEELKEEDYIASDRSEKIALLQKWREKYHEDFLNLYLSLREKRFQIIDSSSLPEIISDYGSTAETIQDYEIIKKDLNILETFLSGAFCIELGGCYILDHVYFGIKNNQILLICCGLWD